VLVDADLRAFQSTPRFVRSQLTWFDREGRSVGRLGSPEHITGFDLSPDGERAIVARYAPLNSFDQDLWLYATMHETNPRRLTTAPMQEWFPRWVNNERFVFTSGGIYQQAVSGERELLTTTSRFWPVPSSVWADGGLTLYSQLRDPKSGVDVWVHARHGDQADERAHHAVKQSIELGRERPHPAERLRRFEARERLPR